VAAAKAELDLRESELTELETGSRPEEIMQAEAARDRARALAEYADARLARVKSLHDRGGSTSLEELEQAVSTATAARQTLAEAEANYKLVLEGPRQEKKLQAKARLDLARADFERLQDMEKKYTIRAPFDGYITTENTEVGEWLSRGDPVVEMIAIKTVEITVSVPEQYIGVQRPGRPAEVRLDALPDEMLPATVSRVIPQADLRSRSFPVKILLANRSIDPTRSLFPEGAPAASAARSQGTGAIPASSGESNARAAGAAPADYMVKAGMLARVTLDVSEPKEALMVPKDALVLEEGRAPLVYVVRKDPSSGSQVAMPVAVQLGIDQGADIEVTGDLRDGEPVVTVGNERLSKRPPFSIVTVQGSEENDPAAKPSR
ncbi:MAG: efflux RND transporter periplasmic adaptor subunit, partial [Planctomycetes bacterium]|nr:efflux RND transporter periplasmic adaptor subunit [Planctomycetota bacterium]